MALPARADSSSYQNPGKRSDGSSGFETTNNQSTASFGPEAANDNQIAAQFHGNKNRARREQNAQNKDPNEADRLELEKLESEIKQDDLDSSITTKNLGDSTIGIELKFDVPLDPLRAENLAQWKANRKKFQNPPTENRESLSPANDNAPQPEEANLFSEQNSSQTDNSLQEKTDGGNNLNEPDSANDDELTDIFDEDYTPYPLADETDTKSIAPPNTDANSAETNQSPEVHTVNTQQNTQEQLQSKKIQDQQQQMANIEQQNALKEQRIQGQLARAEKMKQKLEKKLRNLRAERFILKTLLRTTKVIKAIIDAIQSAVRWLAHGCMTLAWTIILGILGVILYLIYGLLFIPKMALWTTIKLTEKRIQALDEDIEAAEKNKQKVISMIQSLMTRRRTGSSPETQPKFNTSRQVS